MSPPSPSPVPEGAKAGTGSAGQRPLRIPGGPRHQPYPFSELHPTDVLGSFFLCGLSFFAAAAVAGALEWLAPWSGGRWLALHLAFFGGVSQLILGATQFFAGAFLATDPPPRRLVRAQLVFWNGGVVLLAVAVPVAVPALVWAGAAVLIAGLAAWGRGLAGIRRRSLSRNPWATRWYEGGGLFLAAGIAAGALLATGVAWSSGYLTGAHMALNLAGWFGAVIVGTLHTFYPTLTRTRLRFPRLQPPAFGLWCAGVAVLAAGYAAGVKAAVAGGWLLLILSALLLLANVAASRLAASAELSLAARTVGAAQLFLAPGLVLLLLAGLTDGSIHSPAGGTRAAAGTLLVAGWVGLTVAGSLLHLLVTLIRARDHRRPRPPNRPVADRLTVALAAAAVAGLAICQLAGATVVTSPFKAVLLTGYLILAVRIGRLAAGVWRYARPGV